MSTWRKLQNQVTGNDISIAMGVVHEVGRNYWDERLSVFWCSTYVINEQIIPFGQCDKCFVFVAMYSHCICLRYSLLDCCRHWFLPYWSRIFLCIRIHAKTNRSQLFRWRRLSKYGASELWDKSGWNSLHCANVQFNDPFHQYSWCNLSRRPCFLFILRT